MTNILFYKIGAIGDVLMTTPLIRQTRNAFPNSKIDYLIGLNSSNIIRDNQNIDNIIKFDEKIFFEKKIHKIFNLIKKIRNRRYDLVFILDKHWIFKLTAILFNINERIGFAREGKGKFYLTRSIFYGPEYHERYYYLDLLRTIYNKVNYKDIQMHINISDKYIKISQKKIEQKIYKNYIVLINSGGNNPGEKTNLRKLPPNLFMKLVRKIYKNHNIIFLGDDNEKKYYEKFKFDNCINLAGKTSLIEAAYILKKAKKIITTDCGLMHLAATVNKNIISIFGPTNPNRKAPLWPKSKTIWEDQNKYTTDYDLYGIEPDNVFFNRLRVEDIIRYLS